MQCRKKVDKSLNSGEMEQVCSNCKSCWGSKVTWKILHPYNLPYQIPISSWIIINNGKPVTIPVRLAEDITMRSLLQELNTRIINFA